MLKTRLPLGSEQPARSLAYGGALDLVNGTNYRRLINDIKFSAIFYEHLVVPDGFFHCYGPLHSWAQELFQTGDPYSIHQSELTALLKNRIIVPAIRSGESLADNWRSSRDGVIPGSFLNIPRGANNEEILDYFDSQTPLYANWPQGMGVSKTSFSKLLKRFMVDEDSPFGKHKLRPLDSMDDLNRTAYEKMFGDIEDEIRAHEDDPRIRRGQFERIVAKHLNINLTSYQELVDRADFYNPNDLAAAGMEIMSIVSTVYEIYQSREFGTVGTLFPMHRSRVVEEGIYDYLVELPHVEREVTHTPLLTGSFDVANLSIKEVVKIRESTQFTEDYIPCLKAIKNVKPSETFLEANPEYVDCLVDRYLPFVAQHYPSVGHVERIRKGVEMGTFIGIPIAAAISQLGFHDLLTVGWHSVIVAILGATYSVAKTLPTTLSEKYDKHMVDQRVGDCYNNNYQVVWNQRAPSLGGPFQSPASTKSDGMADVGDKPTGSSV